VPVEIEPEGRVIVFGEVMIELSNVSPTSANLGVAGDSFNTAVYMRRNGIEVEYATALGTDIFSKQIIARLLQENIDAKHVLSVAGKFPGLYAIDIDETGERSFTYWRSDSAARYFFEAAHIEETLHDMSVARLLYLSGITLSIFSADNREKIYSLAKRVRENGGLVAFDTNFRISGWRSAAEAQRAIEQLMPFVSIALPTLEDEMSLFGIRSAEECDERWRNAGAEEVVVKAGPKGAFLTNVGWIEPPEIVRPVDTTGAGDSFNGAFLASRLKGVAGREAVEAGHRMAARVLAIRGAII
jgi:2-dehydro-3-deoxygluconokinase